ncbi:peptide ABC transporter permease [Alicyclobacillus cellulosilyticus]|uniref:Peptide ABC transporter permease n=2 Tax=Alicyclobacillus cellulosilyticus TaxID=1003997 RepID=A0A917KA26_9BACL|nr:peptide ABC transporter permease [Alicyclobacillus cellulosilyticus]
MLRFVAQRVGYMIISFFLVSIITFWLMKAAPGSFLELNLTVGGVNAAAQSINVSPELMRALVAQYHLDAPWYVQYWSYVWGFLTLHFGYSMEFPTTPTLQLIARTFPVSFSIAILSVALAVVVSIAAGVMAAIREHSWLDASTMFVATLGTAIPAYVVAVLLALVFGVWLHWLPVIGFQGPRYYVLPVLSLAIPMIGSLSRYMRNSIIQSLHAEYIVAVYAKGGGLRDAILRHALKNSLIPLVTVVGPHIAGLMMGTVLIESMFGLPGMGQVFATAASRRDYPLIMDSTLLYSVVIMLMNLLVDLLYGILDPRIRKRGYAEGR